MKNTFNPKIRRIIKLAETLPYFDFDDLIGLEKDRNYLKVLFSRHEKAGKLIRLKKGLYATRKFVETVKMADNLSAYQEFLANLLCSPSYLSLEYILYEHNLLTEIPKNFTSIAKDKTAGFSNKLGNFFYHKVKEELFCGFEIVKKDKFSISRATKAKALFDYLYLRKNSLSNEKAIEELRLNFDNFKKGDWLEFKKYVTLDKSAKMKKINQFLYHWCGNNKDFFEKFSRRKSVKKQAF